MSLGSPSKQGNLCVNQARKLWVDASKLDLWGCCSLHCVLAAASGRLMFLQARLRLLFVCSSGPNHSASELTSITGPTMLPRLYRLLVAVAGRGCFPARSPPTTARRVLKLATPHQPGACIRRPHCPMRAHGRINIVGSVDLASENMHLWWRRRCGNWGCGGW